MGSGRWMRCCWWREREREEEKREVRIGEVRVTMSGTIGFKGGFLWW